MRKEPFFVGDIVHVFNRGNRKQEIVYDEKDRYHFLQALFYFNDEYAHPNLFRSLYELWKSDFYKRLEWPREWPERNPLVKIHSFVLMNNHYHLILEEIKEGGVTKFMRKLGTGMTNRFNTKYKETGRLFQGAYKARRVDRDNYLQYLLVYVHIKNVFELYSGGLKNAIANFNDAYEFASRYPYSSLGAYFSDGHIANSIIATDMCGDTLKNKEVFKEFAKNCMDFVYFDENTTKVTGKE